MRRQHSSLGGLCPYQILYGFIPKLLLVVRGVVVASLPGVLAPAHYALSMLSLQEKILTQHEKVALMLDF
jgi:hypothetical protein